MFKAWQLRAMRMLSEDRPDVQRLLEWAETHNTTIDSAAAQLGAQVVDLHRCEDVQAISIKILNVLTSMVANSLIPATQSCGEGHGLEFWRSLAARWQGQSKQVVAATLCSFITPARCSKTLDLWEVLPAWEQKASQLLLAREPVSGLMKSQGLNALVPMTLLNEIISRLDLESYDAKLRYVKQHMEHARGTQQSRGTALNSCAVTSEEAWHDTWNEWLPGD